MRIKKKGTTGNAKNFITRTQAVRRLQISLADFRRLCIFKGIYPREPRNKKKANKGSTAPVTFYYTKDIQYLMHEPVLQKFREHKTFAKKLQKALGRGEIGDAEKLESNRPKYTLEHIIKERYPTFLDALRDLDDPLNMLFLFANMPSTDKVSYKVTKEAEKLTNQWLAYVAKERLIKKVFVSIKGVYYEANVKGQEVRWLVPFKFPSLIPSDVDFRIMLTFLEFYSTLLHFILFRVYKDANLIYPPIIDVNKLKSIGGLSAYILKSTDEKSSLLPSQKVTEVSTEEGKHLDQEEIKKALSADKATESNNDNENDNDDNDNENDEAELDEFESTNKTTGDLLEQPSKFQSPTSTLFANFIFYVGREVPLDVLEFCILSCGGRIVSEIALDELKYTDKSSYNKLDLSNITHQIVDRPKIASKVSGRTYIQPQWVLDCINKSELLPVSQYAPGEILPPHLSPWGDSGDYNPMENVPAQNVAQGDEQELEQAAEEEVEDDDDEEEVDEDEIDEDDKDKEDDEEEEEEMDEDLLAQKELEQEAAGVYKDTTAKPSKKRAHSEEDEEKELKKIMMTNKQRKLYNKMQYGINKNEARNDLLAKKKKDLQKTKKQMNKLK